MTGGLRRFRGVLLRLVRHRGRAVIVGLLLVLPAAWVQLSGRPDAWWAQGLSLVVGASGLALLWTGLTGVAPDWIDD
jgi:predicted small integral membrane protein